MLNFTPYSQRCTQCDDIFCKSLWDTLEYENINILFKKLDIFSVTLETFNHKYSFLWNSSVKPKNYNNIIII